MKTAVRPLRSARASIVEAELAELGEECARVLLLLQRLARSRAVGRGASSVLGELSAAVLHLHVHTKGLDRLIDDLPSA